jgi:hypothetical protein
MKRTYTAKGLQQMAHTLRESVKKARGAYDVWQVDTKELDGPKAKSMYKPEHIVKLKGEKRAESMRLIQETLAGMRRLGQPALAERKRWSKESFVKESRFANMPPEGVGPRDDKMLFAVTQLTDAVNRLQTVMWCNGLDDDGLIEASGDAAVAGDLATLGATIAEAKKRGNSLLELKVKGALDTVALPEEAEHANASLEQIDLALQECEVLEQAIFNPQDSVATGRVSFFRQKAEGEPGQEAA